PLLAILVHGGKPMPAVRSARAKAQRPRQRDIPHDAETSAVDEVLGRTADERSAKSCIQRLDGHSKSRGAVGLRLIPTHPALAARAWLAGGRRHERQRVGVAN